MFDDTWTKQINKESFQMICKHYGIEEFLTIFPVDVKSVYTIIHHHYRKDIHWLYLLGDIHDIIKINEK